MINQLLLSWTSLNKYCFSFIHLVVEGSIRVVEDKSEETKEEFIDQTSVIEHLEKMTDNSSQFFIVIRRKVPFLLHAARVL